MAYDLVVDYVRTARYDVVNGARVYWDEKIVLVDAGDFYIAVQAHDEATWSKLLSIIRADPDLVRRIAEDIQGAVDALVPGTVSVMYLRKRDLEA